MFKKFRYSNQLSKEKDIDLVLQDITQTCKEIKHQEFLKLDICDYKFDIETTIEELGLDKYTIKQFIEGYVTQLLNNIEDFKILIQNLEKKSFIEKSDFIKLRELAHKNLGVARNLRITDAEKLLNEIMTKDDLEYLKLCVDTLEVCTIKLSPNTAYNVINMINIKK